MANNYKWILVALLWGVAALNYLDRQIIFSVFPLLQADLHVSDVQLGFLGTAFLWIYGLLSPLGGFIADRFGRVRVIIFSLGIWSAVTWVTGHTSTYGQLVVARGFMGVSEACYLPAALALIADYHSEATRSRAVGIHQSGLYAGIALGGIGGGWVGEHYGWRAAFQLLGIAGLLYATVLVFSLKGPRKGPFLARGSNTPALGGAIGELLRTRPFLMVLAVNTLVSIAYWFVYTWLALYLFERFRMSLTTAGFSSTFYIQIASLAGILGGGYAADRWSRTNIKGRAFTQAIGLAAAGPFLFLVGATGSRWVLVAGLLLFGLGRGFFDCNLMPVVCQIVPAALRATAYGILNFASCIAGGAIAAAGGLLKETIGLGGGIQLSALMLFSAAFLLFLLDIPPQRSRCSEIT